MRTLTIAVALALVLAAGTPAAADTDDVEARRHAIRGATLDEAGAVGAAGLTIALGPAALEVEEGVFVPASPVAGRVLALAFAGKARFRLSVDDPIEAAQLDLFTNRETLDEEIDTAVLLLGDAAIVDEILARPAATPGDRITQAGRRFEAWKESAARRRFGGNAAMLRVLHGDAPMQRWSVAWMHSDELGDFVCAHDPTRLEPSWVGQFIAAHLTDHEESVIERKVRRLKRRGRLLDFEVDDLGDWNTWLSLPAPRSGRPAAAGHRSFEPRHYSLELTVSRPDEPARGKARVELEALVSGATVVEFDLFSDLRVRQVIDAAGQTLGWLQSANELLVLLRAPVAVGEGVTLTIDYDGVLFDEHGSVYPLRDTRRWYPNAGTINRATYDVTFRWPGRLTLLGSGTPVEEGIEDKLAWQRRELRIPVHGVSFEIGRYELREVSAGHVELRVGFGKTGGTWDRNAKEDTLETLQRALGYYESIYGPFPLDRLEVATVPRGFAQGNMGFITLAQSIMWVAPGYIPRENPPVRRQRATEVIAHEMAHQWWGNMVGWHGDRDQWLSEAIADYSATRYAAHVADRKAVYLASHARDWKQSVQRRTADGRTVEELGPVVLGRRLFSTLSDDAYAAVVYKKGSVVFTMLARMLGDEPFNRMLGALAQAVSNRVIDTETFLKAIEKMSGADLGPFAEQFIYGTGYPEVYYDFQFEQAEAGTWIVRGVARQQGGGEFDYRLEATGRGWDVRRTRRPAVEVERSALVVPFQIHLAGAEEREGSRGAAGREVETTTGLGGALRLQGAKTSFEIPISKEPVDFFLDQRGEVLADFYCEVRQPKNTLHYRGTELLGDDRHAEAEQVLRRALSSPYHAETLESFRPRQWTEDRARIRDGHILLELARLYLDTGRHADARQAIEDADERFGRDFRKANQWRVDLHRARLALREGSYEEAYTLLAKTVALDPGRGEVKGRRLRRGIRGTAESYAMLAAAAAGAGKTDVARIAMDQARELGADVSRLTETLEPGP